MARHGVVEHRQRRRGLADAVREQAGLDAREDLLQHGLELRAQGGVVTNERCGLRVVNDGIVVCGLRESSVAQGALTAGSQRSGTLGGCRWWRRGNAGCGLAARRNGIRCRCRVLAAEQEYARSREDDHADDNQRQHADR